MLHLCGYDDAILQLLLGSAHFVQRLSPFLDYSAEYHLPPLIQINLCRVDVCT